MITTIDQVNAVLSEDPDIDAAVFWRRVGIDPDLMHAVVAAYAQLADVPFSTAGALLETGATLAEAGLKSEREKEARSQ